MYGTGYGYYRTPVRNVIGFQYHIYRSSLSFSQRTIRHLHAHMYLYVRQSYLLDKSFRLFYVHKKVFVHYLYVRKYVNFLQVPVPVNECKWFFRIVSGGV